MSSKNKNSILLENPLVLGALKLLGSVAVEEAGAGGITFDKLGDKTDSQEAAIFLKKYQYEIAEGYKTFYRLIQKRVEDMPVEYFMPTNSRSIVGISNETGDSLQEYHKKIIKSKYNLSNLLFEQSIPYATGGLSDTYKLTTSQVKFKDSEGREWRYKIPDPEDEPNFEKKLAIAGSSYFILDGRSELGDIGYLGDPFTYEQTEDGDLMVISAPDYVNPETGRSFKDSIGKTFSIKEPEEDSMSGMPRIPAGMPMIPSSSPAPADAVITKTKVEVILTDEQEAASREAFEKAGKRVKEQVLEQVRAATATAESGTGTTLPFLAVVSLKYKGFPSEPNDSHIFTFITKLYNKMPSFQCSNRKAMVMILIGYLVEGAFLASASQFKDGMTDPTIANSEDLADSSKFRRAAARKIGSVGTLFRQKIEQRYTSTANQGPHTDIELEDKLALSTPIVNWFTSKDSVTDRCGKPISGNVRPPPTPEEKAERAKKKKERDEIYDYYDAAYP